MNASAAELTGIAVMRGLLGSDVDAQLKKGGEYKGLDDSTLLRWLRARKGDTKIAARDLQAHAQWRAAYVPNGRISEADIRDELDQNKAFLPGYDKTGRPCCVVVVRRHIVKDAEASKRYIAYALDCATLMGEQKPGWDGKYSGVFDLRGLKPANCDLATLRNVFDLLQNHYPERLHTLWLYCAPMVFYGIWRMVRPFIDPVTREKVKFVYEKDGQAELVEAFDMESLPPELCPQGTGTWITIEQRYQMLLQQQQQQQPGAPAPAEAPAAAAVPAAPPAHGNGVTPAEATGAANGHGSGREEGKEAGNGQRHEMAGAAPAPQQGAGVKARGGDVEMQPAVVVRA